MIYNELFLCLINSNREKKEGMTVYSCCNNNVDSCMTCSLIHKQLLALENCYGI